GARRAPGGARARALPDVHLGGHGAGHPGELPASHRPAAPARMTAMATDAQTQPAGLSRHYVKLLDRRDFDDPEILEAMHDIAPKSSGNEVERKFWEYAMLGLFLRDVGALREDAEM